MLAAKKKKSTTTTKKRKVDNDDSIDTFPKKLPPFIKRYKHTVDGKEIKYKTSDTKKWQGKVWYFCDFPYHRDRVKWNTHPTSDCRTRKRWLMQIKIKYEAEVHLGKNYSIHLLYL